MLHQWIEFERGMWAGLDGAPKSSGETRQYYCGYQAGREILSEMERRKTYVPEPKATDAEYIKRIAHLQRKFARECQRSARAERARDQALRELSHARSRLGRVVDGHSVRSEVRP